METQFGRKPPLLSSLSSIFIINKTSYHFVVVQTHTSTQAPTCRKLQPSLILQPLLEGSSNPLTEGFDPQHHRGPRFINFHIGSNNFNTTQLVGLFSLEFLDWTHSTHLNSKKIHQTETHTLIKSVS